MLTARNISLACQGLLGALGVAALALVVSARHDLHGAAEAAVREAYELKILQAMPLNENQIRGAAAARAYGDNVSTSSSYHIVPRPTGGPDKGSYVEVTVTADYPLGRLSETARMGL